MDFASFNPIVTPAWPNNPKETVENIKTPACLAEFFAHEQPPLL